ncbi:MAG: rhodanese-like domain-containing protein [Burkholderiaceae bacterium]
MQALHPTELVEFLSQHPDAVLLDVREPWEVAQASIALQGVEMRAVPMNQIPREMQQWPQNQTTVCICHHGVRSAQVGHYLEASGWSDVVNLSGGIDAWSILVDSSVPRY